MDCLTLYNQHQFTIFTYNNLIYCHLISGKTDNIAGLVYIRAKVNKQSCRLINQIGVSANGYNFTQSGTQ